MRKGLFFWGGFILCFAIIGLAIFFMGKQPEQRAITEPIPIPEPSAPYVYLEGKGDVFDFDLPEELVKETGQARPFLLAVQGFSPVLSYSQQGASLITWESNQPHLYGSALFSLATTQSLEKGEFPQEWKEIEEQISITKEEDGSVVLMGSSGMPPLYVHIDGGLTLLSTSREGLNLMKEVLNNTKDKLDMSWKVSADWASHFRFYDGGIFSQLLSLDGVEVSLVPFTFDAAWNENEEKGELRWKTTGIEGVIPAPILERLSPIRWDNRIVVPEPLMLAGGLNVPDVAHMDIEQDLTEEIPEGFPFSSEEILELLKGPLCVTVGGSSKFIFFSLPGILLQLPDRGVAGVKLVNEFWSQEWRVLVPSIQGLEGFHAGGTSDVPLTVVGAAREDLAIFGVMQKDEIQVEKKISSTVPALKNNSEAFAWLYAHGARLADAFDVVARASAMAGKLGSDIGVNVEELARGAEKIRNIGEISLVMPSINEGYIRWTAPEL